MSDTANPADRLDSWKAIGDYLGRDIRTLQRWEALGLPVYRVAGGGRGSSVFAYKSEIDAWMRTGGGRPVPAPPPPGEVAAEAAPTPARRWPLIHAATGLIIVGVAAGAIWTRAMRSDDGSLVVRETDREVIATTRDGRERWRFPFPADADTALPPVPPVILLDQTPPAALAATALSARRADGVAASGVVRWFGITGPQPVREFSFDDRWSFRGRRFDEAWVISDMRAFGRADDQRIAVSARQNNSFPSVVTVLDAQFHRRGTFVNSGWILAARWLDANRLAISGFNQAKNGGMLAVLDATHLDGASPETADSEFACDACGAGRPVFYAVFPRSELNVVTASRFNGAGLDLGASGSLVVHTKEVERETEHGPVAEADYVFSASFDLLAASYGTDYWERHRALERQGIVTHPGDRCPERFGPPVIDVWQPATGWRTIRAPQINAR